uniref:Uncharacterized protein n=1 Tax=Fagus sylvatica TaxID=28930 RepID=A0A2N9G6E9_FAGSY
MKPVERSRTDKRSTPHAVVVTSSNDTRNKKQRGKEKEFEEWPAISCTTEEMHAVIDKWIADGFLRLPGVRPGKRVGSTGFGFDPSGFESDGFRSKNGSS